MIDKGKIFEKFKKEPNKYWKVEMFEKEGYIRKICKECKNGFWSTNDKENCPEHDDYSFIGKKKTNVNWDYVKTWKEFEKFFNKKNHTTIPRYPVISRWHPNLFFTQASIQNFQRFNGNIMEFDYPNNPLIVPQVCLRFNDIENVGITGRHMTSFIMAGQHSFEDNNGYWKDKCIELNFEFLNKIIGIKKDELIYTEDIWSMNDMSAFGPSIETHSNGLEIVNNVFMQFKEIGNKYNELKNKVIDVGWGFDRLPWIIKGSQTIYDTAFGNITDKLKNEISIDYDEELFKKYAPISKKLDIDNLIDIKNSRKIIAQKLNIDEKTLENKIGQIEAIYALLDHSRALTFAITDGGLPSNVGGGYNLRVITRRAMSFIEKYNWNIKLHEISLMHSEYLNEMFPEILENINDIEKVLTSEEKKFNNNKKRSKKLTDSLNGKILSTEKLVKLYDSEGITPEQIGVDIPGDFYDKLTEKHNINKNEKKINKIDVSKINPTEILYYKEPEIFNFFAKVICNLNENLIILDKTAFFPTSGGQLNDLGTINDIKVLDVFKIGKIIIHKLSKKIENGENVKCCIDKERRIKLMIHHDAVHIVNGATKKIIGNHIHQTGSEKNIDKARIDITHFETLTNEEIEKIENLSNEIIRKNIPITKIEMIRSDAEQEYGFKIYQGGYVPSKKIRIVKIKDFDIEACSGTHGDKTKDIKFIKIIKTKKISDGVVRIELKAGDVAFEYLKNRNKILKEISDKLDVSYDEIPEKVKEIFNTWKKLRKGKR